MNDKIEAIRNGLTPAATSILHSVWQYWCDTRKSKPVRVLHLEVGKTAATTALEELGGSIIRFQRRVADQPDVYELTTLGVLIAGGSNLRQLLCRYLEYVAARVRDAPTVQAVTSDEVRAALDLDGEALERLRLLLFKGEGYPWECGGSTGPSGWRADLPEGVDDLPEVSDMRTFLQEAAVAHYDSGRSVREVWPRAGLSPSTSLASAAPRAAGPMLLRDLMHPLVISTSFDLYERGNLREAVLNAVTAVFDLIRQRTGSCRDGHELVGQVFSLTRPLLVLSELETESGKNDQKGFMQLCSGTYQGIRNPKAHTLLHDLTALKAAQYLVLASLLARRVDEATAPTPEA